MLFIFIIMPMSFASNYKDKETAKQEDLDAIRRAVATVDQKLEDLQRLNRARFRFLTELKRALEAEGVDVTIDPRSGVLRLPEAILFETNSAVLKQEGQSATAVPQR